MAIDTAEKRRSASQVLTGLFGVGVTPNASQDLEWRQQAGWGYSGISVITGSGFYCALIASQQLTNVAISSQQLTNVVISSQQLTDCVITTTGCSS